MSGTPKAGKMGPRSRLLQSVRALGPVVAWIGAVACGWKVSLQADLLEAALRGAVAWLGVIVVWTLGTRACEHLVTSARRADINREGTGSTEGSPPPVQQK
jgi:hypothetical protein